MKKADNFKESLAFALAGVVFTFRTQHNFRIHTFFIPVVIGAGWFFSVSRVEWLVLILTIVTVVTAEMVNTALEAVVDLCTEEYHPLAEVAKNTAAGAVLLTAVGAIITGLIVFGPRFFSLFVSAR